MTLSHQINNLSDLKLTFTVINQTLHMSKKSLMILVAGPYRSGTNDDPVRIAANVQHMTDTALEIYRMGHLPVLGEWFAKKFPGLSPNTNNC